MHTKKILFPKKVLPRRCLSKRFCHKKNYFFQKTNCREGANLRCVVYHDQGHDKQHPFFKSAIFNCCQFKKSEHHLDYDYIFTVFLNFHPNRFCFIWEPHELVWKSVWSSLQRLFMSIFSCFQNFQKSEPYFQIFRFQTQENRFWGLGMFLHVFYVHKIINLFTVLWIFYKFSPMLHKSLSYEPSRQYGIITFSKTIIKKSKYL